MTIHAFDFDGTLTTRDSLSAFVAHTYGRWALVWGLLLYSPLLVLMKLGIVDNGHVKERFFSHFFRNMLERDFNALCESFAREYADMFRTKGLKAMEDALEKGDSVLVVSASIDNWVKPCLEQFIAPNPKFKVLGTQIEVEKGRLTGRFATPNCYGTEKVRRLEEYLSSLDRQPSHIIAYGDSRGDKEMLAYANERYYKPFRG